MEELTERLRNILGLTKNEAKVYAEILNTPALSVKEISQTTNIPISRIYETLNSLSAKLLISKKQNTGEFIVVPPTQAISNIMENYTKEHAEKQRTLLAISNYLQEIWTNSISHSPTMGVELISFDQIETFFLEKIKNLKSKILIAAASSISVIDWRKSGNILTRQFEKDVEIKYLVNSQELKQRLQSTFQQLDQFRKLKVEISFAEELYSSFVIVDNELFLFFFGSEQSQTMVLRSTSESLFKTFYWLFRNLWRDL
jgi:sugar-specific transcriptional regulator TrmB